MLQLDITEDIEEDIFKRDPMKLMIYLMRYNQEEKLKKFAD